MSIIRVGDRKLNIPPFRFKGDQKRSASSREASKKARAAIEQGTVSDSTSTSPLPLRTVQVVEPKPDNNSLISDPESSAFIQGLVKEDLAFRETALVVKQKGYQEAIGFYQQIGAQHPKYQEAAIRKTFCTYKLAMMEADIPKKLQLAQEILTHFESADQDSNEARFIKAACKQTLGLGTGDQTLLNEAIDLFAQVDALDSDPSLIAHIALRQGEWKYTHSFSVSDPQIKRELLQEAIEWFSKIQDDRLALQKGPLKVSFYQEVSLRLGDCKFHLAFCSASGPEQQELLREAFNFYARVGLSEPNFTDVANKQGMCKFNEALLESDAPKKQLLLTEAMGFFENVCRCYESVMKSEAHKHPKYVEVCLNKGVCKQECASLEANVPLKLKLYEEALDVYSLARPDHPLFIEFAFRQGECKYQQATAAPSPGIKRRLLEEALGFFTKVPDHHPRSKETSFMCGCCSVELVAFVSNPVERRTLYREALNCFSKIEPADVAYYTTAQEMIQLCHQGFIL